MFTKTIIKAGLAVILATGMVNAAMGPEDRLENVREIFTREGANAFSILNGQDSGGTNSKDHADASGDNAVTIYSEDPNAFIFCVQDGKWAVYPPDPMKVGTDAMSVTDAQGKPFIQPLINAMHNSPDGKASVYYTTRVSGHIQKRQAIVWSSKNLLSRKNDTGKKFFCGTSIKVN